MVQSKEEEGGLTGDLDKAATAGAANVPDREETPAAAATDARENPTEQQEQSGVTDDPHDETTVAEPAKDQGGEAARHANQEETDRHQEVEQKHVGVAEQAEDIVREIGAGKLEEVGNAGKVNPTGEAGIGIGIEQEADEATGETVVPVEEDAGAVPAKPDRKEEKPTANAAVDDDDGSEDSRPRPAMRVGFSTRTREECEEAFVELMLDERSR